MMRSLLAAVSGMRTNQLRMDVIGNNVANVNTVAFKAGRATTKEGFSQLLQNATQPGGDQGGINPIQVGSGVEVGSVDTIFSQGTFESTGQKTDLMIQGSSFFVVSNGSQRFYTRAGNFTLDANGNLVHPTTGFKLQGRVATAGVLQNGVSDIQIPLGMKSQASATTAASVVGNLNADAAVGDTAETSITVYDSLGAQHELQLTFTKTATNTWSYAATCSTATVTAGAAGSAVFNPDGTLDIAGSSFPNVGLDPSATTGASAFTVNLNEGDGTVNGITQFKGSSVPVLRDQDGYPTGDLLDYSIDASGLVTASFSNGQTLTLAQVVLADFNNPAGLIRSGDSTYSVSPNSGNALLGYAGEASTSTITSGGLEMSNVDLAEEFTRMIVAQRGFQANSRVITSSDELLQEVVNLKR